MCPSVYKGLAEMVLDRTRQTFPAICKQVDISGYVRFEKENLQISVWPLIAQSPRPLLRRSSARSKLSVANVFSTNCTIVTQNPKTVPVESRDMVGG